MQNAGQKPKFSVLFYSPSDLKRPHSGRSLHSSQGNPEQSLGSVGANATGPATYGSCSLPW